jgi:hypothetical protein
MKSLFYSSGYYGGISSVSKASAEAMLPRIFKILASKSWIEIGSGTGSWTKTAMDLGVQDCTAVDGPWVRESDLLVPKSFFISHNLTEPLNLGRKFDLALSLEVAEHLDAKFANTIVDSLVSHADIVIFGAAIPMQGGTQHVNEQWPDYWMAKFEERNYKCYDLVRPLFWTDERIAPFYVQNAFLFIRNGTNQELAASIEKIIMDCYSRSERLELIHPRQYLGIATMEAISARLMIRQAPKILLRRILGRIGIRM